MATAAKVAITRSRRIIVVHFIMEQSSGKRYLLFGVGGGGIRVGKLNDWHKMCMPLARGGVRGEGSRVPVRLRVFASKRNFAASHKKSSKIMLGSLQKLYSWPPKMIYGA